MTVRDIFNAVLGFDKELVVENVHKELSHGTSVSVILKEGLIAPRETDKQLAS